METPRHAMSGLAESRSDLAAPLTPSEVAEDDRRRSRFMRRLVQAAGAGDPRGVAPETPRTLVQFWDDATAMPADVRECVDSWRRLEEHGFERLLFDDRRAADYIARHFAPRYSTAFERCGHPAMRCDFFRLCFIAREGGFYVDADDYYVGGDCESLVRDQRLKLQPLCYDTSAGSMVPAAVFTREGRDSADWIFYVNNDPLIAPPAHPVIRLALARATRCLLRGTDDRPDIQSTTGPGNLTASLVRHAVASMCAGRPLDFAILPDWDAVAVSRWPLTYRDDERNWRLWSRSR